MCVGAMVAGGVSVVVGSPVDLIKIRLQAQTGKPETAQQKQLASKTFANVLPKLSPNSE